MNALPTPTPLPQPDREAMAAARAIVVEFDIGAHAAQARGMRRASGTFDDLRREVLATAQRAGKDGPWFGGPFSDGRRCEESAMARRFVALDLDRIGDELAMASIVEAAEAWRGFGYTTASHAPEGGRFKLRLVFETDRAVPPEQYPRLCAGLAQALQQLAEVPVERDTKCDKIEQPLYTVRAGAQTWTFDGRPVAVDDLLEIPETALAPLERAQSAGNLDDWLGELLAGQNAHGAALRIVGRMVARGLDDAIIRAVFGVLADRVAAERGPERARALLGAELDRMIRDARDKGFAPDGGPAGWPEPQPLYGRVAPQPYPIDALPGEIREAVQEVAEFVKAPTSLVASSALAALSLAGQAHADVKRAERLQGPSGLFLLAIADSGERKTTCDGFFSSAIREYEAQQAELAKPELQKHAAAIAAWTAKREADLSKIKEARKAGKSTAGFEHELELLERDKPEPPRVPRLIYGDATPEALTWNLAKAWPAAGVVSSEAGAILGSHGMGRESIMRNLATLNELWDGRAMPYDRRTAESYVVRSARLTVALQVQEATLREFLAKSGALARGSGFLARCLIAWPESTQGTRFYTDPPTAWPALAAFHRRIEKILAAPVAINESGDLSPPVLSFSEPARAAWRAFHDDIEAQLSDGGELRDVRDVASKAADNAARLAALFQVFEGGSAIGADAFAGAARIVAWHLNESLRFFGELAMPEELADAARLDAWLMGYCRREKAQMVPRREAQRHGPVRHGERLSRALAVLVELGRAREAQDGRRKLIEPNPALLRSCGCDSDTCDSCDT